MADGQFAVALHALALLAYVGADGLSSVHLAKSVGTHPAFVRRIVRRLSAAGLVESKPGPGGGYRLARKSEDIRLSDVFTLIERGRLLAPSAAEPSAACPVGKGMRRAFEMVVDSASEGVALALSGLTVADLMQHAVRRGAAGRRRSTKRH